MARGTARSSVIFMVGSELAQAVLLPARADARLVLGRRPHGGRKAFAAPLGAARMLPGPRGVDQHAIPEPGAELGHVAVFHRCAGVDGRTEDAREDDEAALAG